uniref:Uncharacterized protein n=1 Tax=Rhizophora mucronata TaxID=61149 RepID=A0A2P2IVB2_RHIMU
MQCLKLCPSLIYENQGCISMIIPPQFHKYIYSFLFHECKQIIAKLKSCLLIIQLKMP